MRCQFSPADNGTYTCTRCGRIVGANVAARWKPEQVRASCTGRPRPPGPGTILHSWLVSAQNTASWFGWTFDPKACDCAARAALMDQRGTDWCREHIDTIVGWLAEGAKKHKVPFCPAVARWLVHRAIEQADRAEPPETD